MSMTAEIISVGTELLLGNILNTNAQYLSRELAALGITVRRQSTIGDNRARDHPQQPQAGHGAGARA